MSDGQPPQYQYYDFQQQQQQQQQQYQPQQQYQNGETYQQQMNVNQQSSSAQFFEENSYQSSFNNGDNNMLTGHEQAQQYQQQTYGNGQIYIDESGNNGNQQQQYSGAQYDNTDNDSQQYNTQTQQNLQPDDTSNTKIVKIVDYLLARVGVLKQENQSLVSKFERVSSENKLTISKFEGENKLLLDKVETYEKEMNSLHVDLDNLKSENARLKQELELKNTTPINNNNGNSDNVGTEEPRTPSPSSGLLEDEEDKIENYIPRDKVAEQIIVASKSVSSALLNPPTSRPDLDIRGMQLVKAIRSGNVEKIESLIIANDDLLDMRSLSNKETFGFTPLMIAADLGKPKACEKILELNEKFRPDVEVLNQTDLIGRTSLHLAASKLHLETLHLLMGLMGESSVKGEKAPKDVSGITPAGYSALSSVLQPASVKNKTGKRVDALNLLHERGDACISPLIRDKHKARIMSTRKSKKSSSLCSEMIVTKTPQHQTTRNESGKEYNVCYGSASLPGYRVTMEDAVCLATGLGKKQNLSLFAVFDGHCGRGAADFAANNICQVFEKQIAANQNPVDSDPNEMCTVIRNTCLEVDHLMAENPRFKVREIVIRAAMGDEPKLVEKKAADRSGTTATFVVIAPTFFVVANVGDSRTIVLENDKILCSTRDHTEPHGSTTDPEQLLFWEEEKKRILAAGGGVSENGRVLFNPDQPGNHLAMSRALGDFEFKTRNENGYQCVIPEPEMYVQQRSFSSKQFIVLACDGIWDVMSNEKCKDMVLEEIKQIEKNKFDELPPSMQYDQVCEKLALSCLDSNDNLSVVLVELEPLSDNNFIPTTPEEGPNNNNNNNNNSSRVNPSTTPPFHGELFPMKSVQRNLMKELDEAGEAELFDDNNNTNDSAQSVFDSLPPPQNTQTAATTTTNREQFFSQQEEYFNNEFQHQNNTTTKPEEVNTVKDFKSELEETMALI